MEVVPMTVNIWKHCRQSKKQYECQSARQLLFHTFASICRDDSVEALPAKAFVYVLAAVFPSWSEEFFTLMVSRYSKRFDDVSNSRKLKALFVLTIRHSFKRELALAKDYLCTHSALSNLSAHMEDYYTEKMNEVHSLHDMIKIHSLRAKNICDDITLRVFDNDELSLEPLESYPFHHADGLLTM
jgi:hypothetical protein